MHIDVGPEGVRSVGGFITFDRLARSRGALLAGASLVLTLTLGTPGQAVAACGGTSVPTGAHAPSAGGGGLHSGPTTPHGSSSSGGTSCPTTASANPAPLAGVHAPGEAPRHVSLGGVHTWTRSTINSGHSQVHSTINRTLPKP
jgi:hypothetical protein